MKTLTIAGLPWLAHSPSLLELDHPGRQRIFIGLGADRLWRIAIGATWGHPEFATRNQAADLVARTFLMEQRA